MTHKNTDNVEQYSVAGSAVVDAIVEAGVTHVLTVPDYITLSVHKLMKRQVDHLQVIDCCAEDEAIATAGGIWVAGGTPIVVIQNQGLHACMNVLRSMGIDASIPIPMIIGQFGREPENIGRDPGMSRRAVVRVTEPLLEAFGIPYMRLERPVDLPVISQMVRGASIQCRPTAVLVGAPTAWS